MSSATAERAAVAVLAVVVLLLAGCSGDDKKPAAHPQGQSFRSAPGLHPPKLTVVRDTGASAPGDLFLAPKRLAPQAGPMIVDNKGKLVWFSPVPKGEAANSFRVQRYRGRPVLTWWTGHTDNTGHGHGTYYIADTHYRIIKRLNAGNGLQGDMHEFRLTPRGTALITIYHDTHADLSAVGGPKNGKVIDSVVQELDVRTGRVLFQWSSLKHVPVADSYITPKTKFANSDAGYFDYFHVNSATVLPGGNLLISGRNVDAAYAVDRHTGRVIWRLGGKHSTFRMGPGTRTAFQHDAEPHPGGLISIFDNGASPQVHPQSRAIIERVDARRHTVTLVKAYTHPKPISALAEGNAQLLGDGHVFVGWGFGGAISEFARDGSLIYDAKLPAEVETYRAYRIAGWHARPASPPSVSAQRRRGGGLRAFMSWNGATDVARWVLLAGPAPNRLNVAGHSQREGFETTITTKKPGPYVSVRALDAHGRVLGRSRPVKVSST